MMRVRARARMHRLLRLALPAIACTLAAPRTAAAEPLTFGVLPQRSAVLTAGYWNPILRLVSERAGVPLLLQVARSGTESRDAAARGAYDLVYSNHIFQPAVAPAGYRVILRPRSQPIRGQIVCPEESPLAALSGLSGRKVGFPSRAAFVGYAVPMDQLLRRGLAVEPVFGGNQEGIMAQLRAGAVAAAGVNSQVMAEWAAREGFRYRVLWESEPFHNLPIAVHPRVPEATARALRQAFALLADDAEGRRVLEGSAALVGQREPPGFLEATPADYRSHLEFFRNTVLRELE
jgi:phosphonate transport system substrate-binding protein